MVVLSLVVSDFHPGGQSSSAPYVLPDFAAFAPPVRLLSCGTSLGFADVPRSSCYLRA